MRSHSFIILTAMLTRKQKQLITFECITIYETTYKLPILKNSKFKKVQKKLENAKLY